MGLRDQSRKIKVGLEDRIESQIELTIRTQFDKQ